MAKNLGTLITFEGVEGSGKSTQMERLGEKLAKQGMPIFLAREPGGTPIGEAIRAILLDPRHKEMHGLAEFFLYMASRSQNIYENVLPPLEQGEIVLLDRFGDSSTAYQGGGRELGVDFIWTTMMSTLMQVFSCKPERLIPFLTLLYDVPISVGHARKSSQHTLDRLELERVEFHNRTRKAYLSIANKEYAHLAHMHAERFHILDATLPVDELEKITYKIVKPLLTLRGYALT